MEQASPGHEPACQLSNYFRASENEGLCIKMGVIPKQLMQQFCKTSSVKAESWNFSHILTVCFKHCSGILRQNYKNCIFVQKNYETNC